VCIEQKNFPPLVLGSAIRTATVKIEAVMERFEAVVERGFLKGVIHRCLDSVGEGHVLDEATVDADEVMVMRQERLCELEASVFTTGCQSSYEARPLEHVQVSVERALGNRRVQFQKLGERRRSAGSDQKFNESSASRGISLVKVGEMFLDPVVDRGGLRRALRSGVLIGFSGMLYGAHGVAPLCTGEV
jgi:hypothetical protein